MSANYNLKSWWYSGQLTNISGVAVQITDYSDLSNGFVVINNSGSLGTVYIGPSGLTVNTGFPLSPNAGTRLPLTSPSLCWAISESGSINKLSWYGN